MKNNKKILTLYLDVDVMEEIEKKCRDNRISINKFLNLLLKEYLFEYVPPKFLIQRHLRVLEKYIEEEEKENNNEIESLKLCLKSMDDNVNDDITKAKKAEIEKKLSVCEGKIKILDAKKASIRTICEKLELVV